MANSSQTAEKSDLAFRTISEAADVIGVPQHVLRFWETRFPQLQPLKRGGNRRYYRPGDMALLHTIRAMLHDEGLTIRGAQQALAGGRERSRHGVEVFGGDAAKAPRKVLASSTTVAPSSRPTAAAPVTAAPSRLLESFLAPDSADLDVDSLQAIRNRLRDALAV